MLASQVFSIVGDDSAWRLCYVCKLVSINLLNGLCADDSSMPVYS